MQQKFLNFIFLATWLGASVFADHPTSSHGLVVREEAAFRAIITPVCNEKRQNKRMLIL